MKFVCDKKVLSDAVSNVSLAVSPKSTLVALEGILLTCKNNTLTMVGYNLDLGITKTIDVSMSEPGSIILNARLFSDILRKLPSEEVSITTDEKYLTVIRGGGAEFTILGINAQEYPDMPTLSDERSLSIQSADLRSMIAQTLFAVALTEQTPVHTGALFDIEDGILNMVALDGYRLALRKQKVETEETFKFVVPGRTLSEILKLLPEEETEIKMSVSIRHIIFEIDGYLMISRLLEGSFHDYKSAIPSGCSAKAIVDVREMIQCIERASIIITDRIKSPVVSRFTEDAINISCTTSVGKVSDSIPVTLEGNPLVIGFNNKYMIDALKACDCDEVVFELNGSSAPIKIVSKEDDSFLFLVLPVRLNENALS